jgi:hypothetical protein
MANKTLVPSNLIDSLVHGLELAESIIDIGDTDAEGRDLYTLACGWNAVSPNLRFSPYIRESEARELRAVIAEAVEYAETCNYGDEADEDDFPKDVQFARQAEELLSFLGLASIDMQ